MLIYYKDVTNIVKLYLSEKELIKLDKAFLYARKAHKGQKRASGEEYIHHPLAVTLNLAIHRASAPTLIAGLLHDVVEDCDVTLKDIENEFGKDIASLVDAVTKVDSLTNTSKSAISASSIKKILLSGVSDVRALIIKLCDRLHNITTLSALTEEKRQRIAKETLKIYSPLALRLSLFNINKTLEEEAFHWAYPKENKFIEEKLKTAKSMATKIDGKIVSKINAKLKEVGITTAAVLSRQKTNYSIYKKIYRKGKSWEKLFDLLAVRIIVKDIDECFSVLGAMHKEFKHIPKTFKDYITVPKSNGYQSLHTCMSYDGFVFEAQIRTEIMERKANIGIAATWTYKEDERSTMLNLATHTNSWLLDVANLSDPKLKDAEFIENVYSDITSRNIYTFTPSNEIYIIKRGATAIDFAYRVHTSLGDRFHYAVINNQKVDFDHVLTNGSVVKVVTSDEVRTVNKWLSAAKTKYAYSKIKKSLNHINNTQKESYEKNGELILKKLLPEKQIRKLNLVKIANHFKLEINSKIDLFEAVGRKLFSLSDICYLAQLSKPGALKHDLVIDDKTFSGQIKFAKCCKPIPGDILIGVLKNKLVSAHRTACKSIIESEKQVNLAWKNIFDRSKKPYKVKVVVRYEKQESALNDVIKKIIKNKVNISSILTKTTAKEIIFILEVFNTNQVSMITSAIESLPFVISARRLIT